MIDNLPAMVTLTATDKHQFDCWMQPAGQR
ncbi:MAG: hypothetical protein ACI8P9_001064 [Parasphingorhabdus sp.]|jgi:hypothetical protein